MTKILMLLLLVSTLAAQPKERRCEVTMCTIQPDGGTFCVLAWLPKSEAQPGKEVKSMPGWFVKSMDVCL